VENNAMAEKFDPAPTDKHAETVKARSAPQKGGRSIEKGFEGQLPGVRSAEQHPTLENSRQRWLGPAQ
jgi:hypothetical protein